MSSHDIHSIDGFLIDLDGTTYLGRNRISGSAEFIEMLRALDKKFLFLSNNSSEPREVYRERLKTFGIPVDLDEIFTSTEATITYLREERNSFKIFPVGTPSFEKSLRDAGFVLTDTDPDIVLLAFDKTLTYEKLKRACTFINGGVRYLATHPDLVCPTEEGYIPDCGSIIALIKAVTGKEPLVIGKPNVEIVAQALKKLNLSKSRVAIVGDRLYTDILMGVRAGIQTILVLTGETKRQDLENASVKPDFVYDSLSELADHMKVETSKP